MFVYYVASSPVQTISASQIVVFIRTRDSTGNTILACTGFNKTTPELKSTQNYKMASVHVAYNLAILSTKAII